MSTDGENLCRTRKDDSGSTYVSRERHVDCGWTEACPWVFPRPRPTETVVIISQSVSGLPVISLSLASLVPSSSARGSLDWANGGHRYSIARALFAILTIVALLSYKPPG